MVECAVKLCSQYQILPPVPNVKAAECDDWHVIGRCATGGNGWGEVCTIADAWSEQTRRGARSRISYYTYTVVRRTAEPYIRDIWIDPKCTVTCIASKLALQ